MKYDGIYHLWLKNRPSFSHYSILCKLLSVGRESTVPAFVLTNYDVCVMFLRCFNCGQIGSNRKQQHFTIFRVYRKMKHLHAAKVVHNCYCSLNGGLLFQTLTFLAHRKCTKTKYILSLLFFLLRFERIK